MKLDPKIGRSLKKASPTILTCIGAAGVVATAVLAVKATPKADMGPVQLSKWSHSGSFVPQYCGDDRDERDRAGRGDVRTGSGMPQIHCAK